MVWTQYTTGDDDNDDGITVMSDLIPVLKQLHCYKKLA